MSSNNSPNGSEHPQDAADLVIRHGNANNNDDQHQHHHHQQDDNNVFADPEEDDEEQQVSASVRQCGTPQRDILEMPTMLTPMARRREQQKNMEHQQQQQQQQQTTSETVANKNEGPQVKTVLRTSDTFRASPILKIATRDGAADQEDTMNEHHHHRDDDDHHHEVLQRPTPQKLLRSTVEPADPRSYYPPHHQFAAAASQAAPYEYYPHNPYTAAAAEGGGTTTKDFSPNLVSPNNPFSPNHPGYNRYHNQYTSSSSLGRGGSHPYYGADHNQQRSSHQVEGFTSSESFDYSTINTSSGPRGATSAHWSIPSPHNHSPARRAHSYESTGTGMHYSPVKPPPIVSTSRVGESSVAPNFSEKNNINKEPSNSKNGSSNNIATAPTTIWKPRVSEYPSPPRISNPSWDYGCEPSPLAFPPYSGPPPPHFSPAGGTHYNPGGYLPSPRGGWDVASRHHNNHLPPLPHSPHHSSFRYLGGSRSWDSVDEHLGGAFSKPPQRQHHQQQQQQPPPPKSLPLSSDQQQQQDDDSDIAQEQVVETNNNINRGYTYTFSSESLGGSFDHGDDTTILLGNNSKPPIISHINNNLATPTWTPPTRNNGLVILPHQYPPPPDSWYYGGGGGGYPAPTHQYHPHHDPYGPPPPPMHYSPGHNRGGSSSSSMMWGPNHTTPARGPHHQYRHGNMISVSGTHYPRHYLHSMNYPKVTPPSNAAKKKIPRGPIQQQHHQHQQLQPQHSSSSSSVNRPSSPSTEQFTASVEFTKTRLHELLILGAPPSKNNNGVAKDFPPVIVLPPTPHILHDEIRSNDVLLGRGGGTNTQAGNRRFRGIVNAHQPIYLAARRKEKPLIARCIVEWIREQCGKFLKKDEASGKYHDVGCERAEAKTSQALREGLDVRATKIATTGSTSSPPSTIIVKQQQQKPSVGRPSTTTTTVSSNKDKNSSTNSRSMNSVVQSDSQIELQAQDNGMLPPEARGGWVGEGGGYGGPPPPHGYYPPTRPITMYESSHRIRSREDGPPSYHGPPPPHHLGYSPYGPPPPSYYGGPTPDVMRSPNSKRIKWAIHPAAAAGDHRPPLSYPAVTTVLSDEDKILYKGFSPPPPPSASTNDKLAASLVAPSYDQSESAEL